MSLLTNEQISEIVDLFGLSISEQDFLVELTDWNEMQQVKFEPDWDTAPINAIEARVIIYWIDKTCNCVKTETAESIPRPVKPHPHAKLMVKYGEVAGHREDPWTEFEQYDPYCGEWRKVVQPICFNWDINYRWIGDENN